MLCHLAVQWAEKRNSTVTITCNESGTGKSGLVKLVSKGRFKMLFRPKETKILLCVRKSPMFYELR